jgi:hypothetical protein
MKGQKIHRLQWYVVALVTLFAGALLASEYTHGGVVSHHLLDRSDLPGISDWWGLIVLPVLGWLASWFVLHRAAAEPKAFSKASAAVIGALLIGMAMSVGFTTGHPQMTAYVFYAALLLGLVFPVYRAEYALGFVLGASLVFGMVLPIIAALIAAGISATFHLLVRPVFVWAVHRLVPADVKKLS